jgi:hypothetical protein
MKRLWHFGLVAAVGMALASCAGAPKPTVAERCVGYGFTPDTPAFAECRQRETLAEKQRRATIAAGLLASPTY